MMFDYYETCGTIVFFGDDPSEPLVSSNGTRIYFHPMMSAELVNSRQPHILSS
jgi:hypothetical protein